MATYKALLTTAGAAKIAAATAGGTQVKITRMAVGDGGGKLPTPDSKQTKLVNEVYRANLNRLSIDAKNSNYLVAELVIQPDVGGFWMREMGLYDADGVLIAVSNMAESYKPQLAEGSGRLQTLRMVLIVSEIESVALSIDGSTVMATKDYVDDRLSAHEKSRNHPDGTLTAKGFVQLNSSVSSTSETLAATPKAVKTANDNANTRVPSTRKVNNKPLSADIALTSEDVGAMSNLMLATDTTKIKRLDDPSIIDVTNPISISATFEDHPLGASYVVAGQLHNWRRYWAAGAAGYQRLINNDGQIFERIGSYTAAGGWKWFLSDSGYPFGWRKILDSGSMTLTDLTRLGVAQSGDNADITSLSKLTSIASSVKMAMNLEVASSIQANYRVGIMRAGDYEAYMSLTSRAGKVSAENLPSTLTSMGNVYFRVPNTLTDTDPHAGRALGGLSSAIYPAGEGVMRMDARDEAGTIKARIVCDGQTDSVQIANGVFRPESGITLSSTNANSVIRGRNDAVILRDHNNGNVTLSASVKDAGSGVGGTLYLGYNRDTANIYTSAVSVDSPLTVNAKMVAEQAATFSDSMTVKGEVAFTKGGSVGYLEGANHYATKAGAWEGAGGFSSQYTQPKAPFIVPYGYTAPKDVSSYAPITKGVIQTTSYGYGTAVSFGAYTSGGQKFASAAIHAIGDSGVTQAWLFDPTDGSFSCPGSINGGNIYSSLGIYEQGQRVYSPNYRPTPEAINAIARDTCSTAGFVSANANDPYMRHSTSNAVVILSTRDQLNNEIAASRNWANADLRNDIYNWCRQSFVTAVRLGSERVQASTNDSGGVVSLGGGELFTGAAGVGGSDFNRAQWRVRQLQYFINGQWVAAGSI